MIHLDACFASSFSAAAPTPPNLLHRLGPWPGSPLLPRASLAAAGGMGTLLLCSDLVVRVRFCLLWCIVGVMAGRGVRANESTSTLLSHRRRPSGSRLGVDGKVC
jgi:hypothetical protein